jgi:hypothetical protein
MNTRLINWIWHVRGSLALAPGQTSEDALDRLDPLFRQTGTRHERAGDTLSFRKKDQPAQDKMSVFDEGTLRVGRGPTGPVLEYHLISRALLFCFLAPVLFLCISQVTVAVGKLQKPETEAADKAKKEADAKKKAAREAKMRLNPIDQLLGAPAPEKPSKKDKDKEDGDKKPSPTAAYVFAGIFAALYLIGRVLEDKMVKTLFRKRLLGT